MRKINQIEYEYYLNQVEVSQRIIEKINETENNAFDLFAIFQSLVHFHSPDPPSCSSLLVKSNFSS